MTIESGWAAVSGVVDGECMPTADGYEAETATRKLFVRYAVGTDPATALVVCMAQGVILEKLRRMSPEKATVVYATTLETATPVN